MRRDADRHLWQIPAVRELLILLGVVLVLWLLYVLRNIFLPVFFALILAAIFNPLVTRIEKKWRWPRPVTVILIMAVAALALAGFLAWLAPVLFEQFGNLARKLPDYFRTLAATYGLESGNLVDQFEQSIRQLQLDPQQILGQIFRTTGRAVSIITFVVTGATYWILALILIAIYFFFFLWRFNIGLSRLSAYVPESKKERVFAIAKKMDDAVGDFFRGRLLIALIVAILISAGWFFTDVPYWFFLGMLTGFLNVVPYLSIITWPVAILLKYVDAITNGGGEGAGLLSVVVWPSAVYLAVQLLDNWVLTPWIQSGQTNLSVITIILVVIIGGALGGVMGMLLAIPAAACIKILFEELVLPRLRTWAATH